MAIVKDNQIIFHDWNSLVGVGTSANALLSPVSAAGIVAAAGIIWGTGWADFGWGQTTPSLPNKYKDDLISHSEWANLITIQNQCADRTGSAITRYTPPKKDDPIVALSALGSNNTTLAQNRHTIPEAHYQNTALLAQNVRSAAWSTTITCRARIDWATTDTARWWFNSGSQILLKLNHNTNASPQDTAWNTALSSLGDIVIGAHRTTWGLGESVDIGYWTLNTTHTTLINQSVGTGVYSGDLTILVTAATGSPENKRGDNSPTLYVTISLTDNHTGFSDSVTGGYTRVQIYGRRSTQHFTPIGPAAITFPLPF